VREPVPVPAEPLASDTLASSDIDAINKNSPFQPVFFALDEDGIDSAGQATLNSNAELMKKYPTWIITIEGHADERGTAEYNLALGERRALAARNYLVSLGISADRLRTVSYGKEFPFEPGHDEGSWSKNRRAHFVVTSK
jgi:peptidoglycan-associated lipoprotein